MYRKVLFNNFHFSIFGTIDIRSRIIEKTRLQLKIEALLIRKDYAKPTMLITRDLHPRMKLRGRRARTCEEEKKAFSFFSYLSKAPFAITRTFIPPCHAGYCIIKRDDKILSNSTPVITSRTRLLDSVMLPIWSRKRWNEFDLIQNSFAQRGCNEKAWRRLVDIPWEVFPRLWWRLASLLTVHLCFSSG